MTRFKNLLLVSPMVTFENICQGLDRFLCPDTSMSHLLKVVTFSLVICVTDMSVFV